MPTFCIETYVGFEHRYLIEAATEEDALAALDETTDYQQRCVECEVTDVREVTATEIADESLDDEDAWARGVQ